MRELTSFKVNGCNEALKVEVMDEPGSGGANHRYDVSGFDAMKNPSVTCVSYHDATVILFQNGPIPEKGTNGVTQEVLLSIIEDRLIGFQNGRPYACRDNAEALEHVQAAMACLKRRTEARVARGIEGTHAI